MKILPLYIFLSTSLFLLAACEGENNTDAPNFDRTTFLQNYANNIIKPSSTNFRETAEQLQQAINTFTSEQNASNLKAAQDAWDRTYKNWMRVNTFNFGPGGTAGLRRTLAEEVGVWPVDVEEVEAKIAREHPDFEDSRRNTRGLLAVEYLLFGEGTDEEVLNNFDAARAEYLQKTADKLLAQITDFDTAWQGDFAAEFIANDGTSVKSSTTLMYNEFTRSFESIKDLKLGIPLGVIAGQTEAQPEQAEARFSENSLDYLLLHYEAIVDLWYGRTAEGADGVGWQEYVLSAEGGKDLVEATLAQFDKVQSIIDRLPVNQSLQELAVQGNPTAAELQNELQNLTRFLKSDLSSLLSLAITFSSMDGD